MKIGSVASPWRYGVGAFVTPRSPKLRPSAIAGYV
jgi:hypothetical protein